MRLRWLLRQWALVLFLLVPELCGAQMPDCLAPDPAVTIESILARAGIGEEELLARLVYAEAASTGFPDDAAVYEAIAWGVMNRVRLGEASASMRRVYGRGVRGVIFKKGQFNPAVSPRSRFSRMFLCPNNPRHWAFAVAAAQAALLGEGNPFIVTAWEKEHGLSLVVNFYYPCSTQAKGPHAPWEKSGGLRFTGDVTVGGHLLGAERVRFYRLVRPPRDVCLLRDSAR